MGSAATTGWPVWATDAATGTAAAVLPVKHAEDLEVALLARAYV